jgi:hypothetical protein
MASLIRAVATSGARASTFCGVARGGDVRGARAAVWAGARSLRSPAPPFHAHSLPCFVRTWARSGRRAPRAVRSIRIAPVLTWCGRARARARAWQREPGTSARVAGPNLPRPSRMMELLGLGLRGGRCIGWRLAQGDAARQRTRASACRRSGISHLCYFVRYSNLVA